MKIGIDITSFMQDSKHYESGKYIYSLIEEILKVDNNFEYCFLNLYEKYEGDFQLDTRCQFYQYNLNPLFLNPDTIIIIKTAIQHYIEKSCIDIMFFLMPDDSFAMYEMDWFSGIFKIALQSGKPFKNSNRMDMIFSESDSVKDDAIRFLHICAEKSAEKNCKVSKNEPYKYVIQKQEVCAVARLYARNGLLFSEEIKEELANQLIMLELHQNLPDYDAHHRILYDMTVVSGWMQDNYIVGIARVSIRLFQELSKIMPVIPVKVQRKKNRMTCHRICMEDYQVTNHVVYPREGDVFFMPELQIRGVQVSRQHPYIGDLRKKGIKTYAVVYDILPLRMPQYFDKATSRHFDKYLREIVTNYDGIISDSQCVSNDIVKYCGDKKIKAKHLVKIGYFHNGQDAFKKNNRTPSSEIQNFFDTGQKIYLMVGTIEPRKGYEIIFHVFKKLWTQGFEGKLCIIGHMGWNMDDFIKELYSDYEYGNHVQHFDHASDADVEFAYRNANCLVQASAGEGFGLPLVEASNYKIPILCSDIPVFHEVAGDAVVYFDRNNSESIIDCILKVEKGEGIKDSSCIPKISWKETAEKIYQMIINDKGWVGNI